MPPDSGATVTIGPQGRLVVPVGVRRRLGIEAGDELSLRVDGGRIVLEPRAAAVARVRGMYRHLATQTSVVEELRAARRQDARREEHE
jgi:AbrB family looped-hinge helix DNA binding protein